VNAANYSRGPATTRQWLVDAVITVGAFGGTIALAASRDAARPWTRRTTAIVVGMFCVHIAAFTIGHDKLRLIQVLVGGFVWAVAWFAGERTRLRRQEIEELEQRAVRAERNAIQDRRLALAEERTRIARDLHHSARTRST
jgi:signal transduction histidine kinase